jgi:predicted O-linked N-acetylglucosamine transferase (SPINDLY family)
MPDLITGSVEEYETLARTLSRSPQRLAEIRGRLQDNRTKMPLFDTPRFAKGIEAAFDAMWERYRRGLAPDHIQISDQEACPIPGNNRGFQ